MAQAKKKQPKRSLWLKRFLLFVFVPLFVWFLAFLIWFNWSSLEKLFRNSSIDEGGPAKASRKSEKTEKAEKREKANRTGAAEKPNKPELPSPPVESRPTETNEKILDEDRKRLEDILQKKR